MSRSIRKVFPDIYNGRDAIKAIGEIIAAVKTVADIFKKSSEEAGKTDSDDSKENIENIIEIFTRFREQIHERTLNVEKAVEDEVNYYAEEFHDILQENAEKVVKYGIHTKRIDREIDKVSTRVKKTIDNELSKKVSLDNTECKQIIRMIPGAKKESAMEDFFSKSVREALEAGCTELHSSLDEIFEDVETEVIGTVESIQKQAEQLQGGFSEIDEKNYEETAKKQMVEAYYLSDVCNLILELL